jgi:hypothetical protein
MMKSWFNDIHALDMKTLTWRQVEAAGKPPTSAYHSCTLYKYVHVPPRNYTARASLVMQGDNVPDAARTPRAVTSSTCLAASTTANAPMFSAPTI